MRTARAPARPGPRCAACGRSTDACTTCVTRRQRPLPLRVHDVRRAVQDERRVAQADEGELFARTIPPDPPSATPVTDVLYERVDPSAIAEVEDRLTPAELGLWEAAPPAEHRRLALAFGVHHGVPAVLEATGLRSATPPTEIHAMERSSGSAGGSTYYADMIIEAAREYRLRASSRDGGTRLRLLLRARGAGVGRRLPGRGMAWLRSARRSGRMGPGQSTRHRLRPEPPAAAAPLRRRLARSGVRDLDLVPLRPARGRRLARRDEAGPAARWAPRADHARGAEHRARSGPGRAVDGQLEEIERALYRDGFWFVNEFGAEGDHGLHDAEWGTAFFSPEWLLRHAGAAWRVTRVPPRPRAGQPRSLRPRAALARDLGLGCHSGAGRRAPPAVATWRLWSARARTRCWSSTRGRSDRSVEIARGAGVDVIEIAPAEFGHGRTRNLGRRSTGGDLICFLTQDAVPVPGWLAAYRDAFRLAPTHRRRLRAAPAAPRYQPDDRTGVDRVLRRVLPRRCAGRAGRGRPRLPVERERLLRARLLGGAALSRRAVRGGSGVRPRDAGRRLAQGLSPERSGDCMRTTTRHSSSCAGTSTSTAACGTRSVTSSRCRRGPWRASLAARWPATLRWMREQGWSAPRRARWAARSALHHSSRQVFAGLGSRSDRLPARSNAGSRSSDVRAPRRCEPGPPPTPQADVVARGRSIGPARTQPVWEEMLRLSREGQAALRDAGGRDERASLPARGRRDPPVHPRQRWSRLDLPDRARARAHGAYLLHLDARPARAPLLGKRGGAAEEDRGRVPAGRSPGLQGLRRLVRGRRRGRHGLGDRGPVGAPARLSRARVPDPRSRAGVLRDVGRAPVGRADLRTGPLPDLREHLAARPGARPIRPRRLVVPLRRRPRRLPPP